MEGPAPGLLDNGHKEPTEDEVENQHSHQQILFTHTHTHTQATVTLAHTELTRSGAHFSCFCLHSAPSPPTAD